MWATSRCTRVLWRTPRHRRTSSRSSSGFIRVEWAHSFIGLRLLINYESASEEHIHSIAEKVSSRKPGFRCIGYSETELPLLPYSFKTLSFQCIGLSETKGR